MWVPVAVWQPCELLYTCYLLTYLLCVYVNRLSQAGVCKAAGQFTVAASRAGRAAWQCTTAAILGSRDHLQLCHVTVQPADGAGAVSSWWDSSSFRWALLVVIYQSSRMLHAFSALTLLVGWQEGHPACKNWVMLQVCCCRPSGQVILIDCCSGRRMQAVPCCQHTYVAEQTLVSLSVSSGTTQVSRYQRKVKPIWNLLKQDTVSGSGISWVICKSALRSRQITTPAHHHSVFYRPDAIPDAQPTAWKHWRHIKVWALKANNIIK